MKKTALALFAMLAFSATATAEFSYIEYYNQTEGKQFNENDVIEYTDGVNNSYAVGDEVSFIFEDPGMTTMGTTSSTATTGVTTSSGVAAGSAASAAAVSSIAVTSVAIVGAAIVGVAIASNNSGADSGTTVTSAK